MIHDIRVYPAECLSTPSATYEIQPNDLVLARLLTDLRETSLAVRGIGLAAPQIGINVRVAVAVKRTAFRSEGDPRWKMRAEFVDLINPSYEALPESKTITSSEGCLSFPGETFKIPRFDVVEISYTSAEGRAMVDTCDGEYAIEVQHEIDHLNGVTVFDLVRPFRRDPIRSRMKKLGRRIASGAYAWPPRLEEKLRRNQFLKGVTTEAVAEMVRTRQVDVGGVRTDRDNADAMRTSGYDFNDGIPGVSVDQIPPAYYDVGAVDTSTPTMCPFVTDVETVPLVAEPANG